MLTPSPRDPRMGYPRMSSQEPRAAGTGPLVLPLLAAGFLILAACPLAIPVSALSAPVLRWRGWRAGRVAICSALLTIWTAYLLRHAFLEQARTIFELAKDQRAGSVVRVHLTSWAEWLLALPLGVFIASASARSAEVKAGGAEWSLAEQRRKASAAGRDRRRVRRSLRALRRGGDAARDVPALGAAYRGGDLTGWIPRRVLVRVVAFRFVLTLRWPWSRLFVVIPPATRKLSVGVFGNPGRGKSVTLQHHIRASAAAGAKVFVLDCKGTDPGFGDACEAAFALGRGQLGERGAFRSLFWPEEALDLWRPGPAELASVLMQASDFGESPHHQALHREAVRLACQLPDPELEGEGKALLVESASDFLRRLTANMLSRGYQGHQEAMDSIASLTKGAEDHLGTTRLRFKSAFDAVAGKFDGRRSFEDADFAYLRVPPLADPEGASIAMRLVLGDFAHYAANRKRRAEPVVLVIDEFSAVSGLAGQVVNLVERLRDLNVQVVIAAQSFESVAAEEWLARRLVASLSALIVHGMSDPEPLLRYAGTVRQAEQSWQLDEYGSSGMGSVRMAYHQKVEPDHVRQAGVGEAWVIEAGRVLHFQARPPLPEPVAARGRELAERLAIREAEARLIFGRFADPVPEDVAGPVPGLTAGERLALPAPDGPEMVPSRELDPVELPGLRLRLSAAVRAGNRAEVREVLAAGRVLVPSWDGEAELEALRRFWWASRHHVLALVARVLVRAWRAALSTSKERAR